MIYYKLRDDYKSYPKGSLLTADQVERKRFNINFFDQVDVPKMLTFTSFGVRKLNQAFNDVIGYHCDPIAQVEICLIDDYAESIYIRKNGHIYRMRTLHYLPNERVYFNLHGSKYYLDECLRRMM